MLNNAQHASLFIYGSTFGFTRAERVCVIVNQDIETSIPG